MTTAEIKRLQKLFIEKAEKKGFTVEKNNIKRAKPLDSVCGVFSTKKPISFQDMLSC